MSKALKVWLIIAISLIIIGGLIFTGTMYMLDWDFRKLNTTKSETIRYEITEEFTDINIKSDTADIKFKPSTDGKTTVVCEEEANEKYEVKVENGKLSIKLIDTKKWYDRIGFSFNEFSVTVNLPAKDYQSLVIQGSTGDIEIAEGCKFVDVDIKISTGCVKFNADASGEVSLKTSTGDISAENISPNLLEVSATTGNTMLKRIACAGDIKLKASTGDATLTDISCRNLVTVADTGDLKMKQVVATERLEIETDSGDVKFESCDAAEIDIETDTGCVKGSLLSEKVFIVETDTGSIDVPKSIVGGRCEISTDTGDIKISIKQ